ncbi:MAG: oligosaccharide flippase family protein, partial [Pseudomonadota bacterium]|nr:oligosaccharide flippase family protein [Pseudomonadota bacterium]
MNDGQVKHLGRRMASGALWMVLLKLAMRGIGLISTIVLARLLVPQDFGLVAMATSLVVMLEMMSEFQFDMALIKDQQAADYHYNTAWTLNIIKGLVTGLLIVAIAYP